MNICYLTPSDRTDVIRGALFRPEKKQYYDDHHTISVAAFNQLPASKKAGFLLLPQNNVYVKRYSEVDSLPRREAAHRLVEASKSPTTPEMLINRAMCKFNYRMAVEKSKNCIAAEKTTFDEVENGKQVTPHNTAGTSTVIQFKEWAEEYRIRTQVDCISGSLPPAQEGERISELLTSRGAKKISESCEYMALKKGGYKTFVTGTFNDEVRAKIKAGETSIQKEVSRCMDAMQKMYQRGWTTSEGESIGGHSEGLSYCWVVEVPINEETYEENPHVHMLLGWRVAYRHFAAWSSRIEKIWGNGYFHLEKIKDCASAGAYMAKAAGYMTKAEGNASQGRVRGNRYGISEPARAPDWVTVGRSQLHSMGQIIADVYDHLTVKHGGAYRLRKKLNEQLASVPKTAKWTREQIGKKLQAVREHLNKIPVRCNKYQIILKGRAAADMFITWAKGERVQRPDWLPELPAELAWQEGRMPSAGDGHYFRKLKEKFQWLKRCRQAFTNEMCAAWVDRVEEFKNDIFSMWSEYERFDSAAEI